MQISDLDASALSAAIHARQVSCREVMRATLDRIAAVNPAVNAIVNLADEASLLRQADDADRELAAGRSRGWLHGVPQAIKDAAAAQGFPTTLGNVLLKDAVAESDGLTAARMKAAGAIVIGKTNIPEFGLGSHTFNELFGATRNAWDPTVTAGGSSGGAAVALALRLLPVADGSDFMGSLRNPAAWNHVFGLRPSQGRVPGGPKVDVWVDQLATEGPMARTVTDLARLLAIQAGPDPAAPLSLGEALEPFEPARDASALRGLRIGWLGDLGGHLAMEDGLIPLADLALQGCERAGAIVEPARIAIDLDAVWHAWLLWRRALVGPRIAQLLARPGARGHIKPEALWEHDQSLQLTNADFMHASAVRSALHAALRALFEQHDVLALPATQVWPFPIGERWPKVVAGRTMQTYHHWMEATIYATFAGLPAISVPMGFHANGRWPAGLQLIGRPRGDAALLRAAAAYEQLHAGLIARRP
jgi:amidase